MGCSIGGQAPKSVRTAAGLQHSEITALLGHVKVSIRAHCVVSTALDLARSAELHWWPFMGT